MLKRLTSVQKAYLAGFLDGDGSVYVRAKPNPTYRYGFQIAPYVVLFQSSKESDSFSELCKLIDVGHLRTRSDGILEYVISKAGEIREFLHCVAPYVVLKKRQIALMLRILEQKERIECREDFAALLRLIDLYRELNYSKKRKERALTP
ncbi:MAG: LAGLIDADG family homing endonuclease [Patescibacteria group bacterium]